MTNSEPLTNTCWQWTDIIPIRMVSVGAKIIPPFLKPSPIPNTPAPMLPRNRCIRVSTYLDVWKKYYDELWMIFNKVQVQPKILHIFKVNELSWSSTILTNQMIKSNLRCGMIGLNMTIATSFVTSPVILFFWFAIVASICTVYNLQARGHFCMGIRIFIVNNWFFESWCISKYSSYLPWSHCWEYNYFLPSSRPVPLYFAACS